MLGPLHNTLLCVCWLQARELNGTDQTTHPFVRAQVGDQALQTSVQWQATSPHWEEALSFRSISLLLLDSLWLHMDIRSESLHSCVLTSASSVKECSPGL